MKAALPLVEVAGRRVTSSPRRPLLTRPPVSLQGLADDVDLPNYADAQPLPTLGWNRFGSTDQAPPLLRSSTPLGPLPRKPCPPGYRPPHTCPPPPRKRSTHLTREEPEAVTRAPLPVHAGHAHLIPVALHLVPLGVPPRDPPTHSRSDYPPVILAALHTTHRVQPHYTGDSKTSTLRGPLLMSSPRLYDRVCRKNLQERL